ncbi:Alpha/Beta hydrolase protein, partial [Kalaharituber pfeilii]
ITGALFPLSYKEGFAQWWAGVSPAVAEATVLSFLPFNTLPIPSTTTSTTHSAPTATPPAVDPYGPRVCSSTLVQLSGKDRSINEFAITRTGEEKQEDLVILHGYGAGLGFFYRNFDTLSRRPGWKMWALDLLGMGRSSRPPFKIHATDKDAKIREAEDWFIDALEEWRVKRGIDRFTVVGHSLGGYLATAYTLKYPGRIKKLILASPVGIPEDPWAVKENLPENPPKDQSHPPPPDTGLQTSTTSLPSTVSTTTTTTSTRPPPRRIPKWVHCLWEANVSPFSLVRWSGPLGPRLVSGWTSRRFSFLPTAESQALHTYSYSLFRQRGSGEYALAYILAPGAYARNPLIWRIGKVGIPTVLMYGEVDWMDVAGGYAAEEAIRQQGVRRDGDGTEPREGEPGGGEAKVLIVKGAGHHVYLDGWEEFNEMIVREMEDV